MTTPHTEEPAEGPDTDDVPDSTEPHTSNPDKTGESIDAGSGPADHPSPDAPAEGADVDG